MSSWHLARAVSTLATGGVLLHAAEGVWGLACDPFDRIAVIRLLALKQRDVSKGLILVGADAQDFAPETSGLSDAQRHAVLASWPGPQTWVLPSVRFPLWITGGRDTVAVRVAGHPQVTALCAKFGSPIVSTSANPSGRPPALNQVKARAYFQGLVDYVLPGEILGPRGPSRICTLEGEVLRGGL